MNKLLIIFFAFTLFSCIGKNEGNLEKTERPAQLTQMVFEEELHDFGKLKMGEIVVYSFVFANTGENDLWIENAESDCACIQVKLPENPVKKGEKGIVEVEFDSSGMFGKNLKPIEIHANCEEPKHLVIFADIENEQLEFNY